MTGKLRIAFVVHDYHRQGGHARYTAELATRFAVDHDVHVFANRYDPTGSARIHYHHVPAWRRNALTTILSFIGPGTIAIRDRFDVVHAQGLCGLRHDVATAHFCQPGWYGALARQQGRLTWKQWFNQVVISPLERYALAKRSTRRVIAISEGTRRDLAQYYRRSAGVSVIYHGIDLDTFHPRNRATYRDPVRTELAIPPGSVLALFVGNLQKGAAAAIRAVARVPGVILALVSGSDTSADRAVAAVEGVTDRVRFVPASQHVERYFGAADAFVFPTIYEPYGMVISEAMASGLPVVTSRTAGAAELITHGIDGLLTDEPWDVSAIACHLEQLRDDPVFGTRMGTSARARVEEYTWDRVATETMAVYREVLAER